MKTAKVTASKFVKEGVSQHGPWFMFNLTLDNGKKGTAFLKDKADPTGNQVIYESEEVNEKGYTTFRGLKLADTDQPTDQKYPSKVDLPAQTGIHTVSADAKELRITMLSCISSAANYLQQREAKAGQLEALALKLYHLALTQKVDDKAVTDDLPF